MLLLRNIEEGKKKKKKSKEKIILFLEQDLNFYDSMNRLESLTEWGKNTDLWEYQSIIHLVCRMRWVSVGSKSKDDVKGNYEMFPNIRYP